MDHLRELTSHHRKLTSAIAIEKRYPEGLPKKFALFGKQHFATIPGSANHARPNLSFGFEYSSRNKFQHGREAINGNRSVPDMRPHAFDRLVRKFVAVHQKLIPEPTMHAIAQGRLLS